MKRMSALPLLLAAALSLAAPFAAMETGWPEFGELAAKMGSGSEPDITVSQAQDKPWRSPAPAASESGGPTRLPDKNASQAQDRPWRSPTPAASESGGATRQPDQAGGKADDAIRLFQSAAFRGSFEALPKWKRVLSKAREEVRVLNSCAGQNCPPGATSWQRIMQQAKEMERMDKLKSVNAFFNKWPYRLDQDAYGTSDWWATPQEFLKTSGDCEDYAISKYFALRELGFAQADLRIVALKDRIRGIGHAVLVAFSGGEAYVMDNLTNAVFPHDRYTHYTPQYSVNEEHRWSHIPLAKQP